jgi:hypothetical protein
LIVRLIGWTAGVATGLVVIAMLVVPVTVTFRVPLVDGNVPASPR